MNIDQYEDKATNREPNNLWKVHIVQRIQRCLRAGQTNTCCRSWLHQLSQEIWGAQSGQPWTM